MTTARTDASAAFEALDFDQPLPRAIVHKAGLGEVFITDSRELSSDRFQLAAELPRSHAFYSDTTASTSGVDLLAITEIGRQSAYVVVHRHLGVPTDAKYVVRQMGSSLAPGVENMRLHGPTRLLLDFEIKRTFQRGTETTGLDIAVQIEACDGPRLAEFHGSFSWMNPSVWKAFRVKTRQTLGLPAAPPIPDRDPDLALARDVGRTTPGNAVIARPRRDEAGFFADLCPDVRYAPLFDHAHHHLPGMAQIEGARQLAVWAVAGTLEVPADELAVLSADVTFDSVTELDLGTVCRATLHEDPDDGSFTAHVEVLQAGRSVGTATISLARR